MSEEGRQRMFSKYRPWLTIEGFWFWLAIIQLLVAPVAFQMGMDASLNPNTAWGRVVIYPGVALVHGSIAALILLLLLPRGRAFAILRAVLGWIAVGLSFYSFWEPGLIVTTLPLAMGGIRVALHDGRAIWTNPHDSTG